MNMINLRGKNKSTAGLLIRYSLRRYFIRIKLHLIIRSTLLHLHYKRKAIKIVISERYFKCEFVIYPCSLEILSRAMKAVERFHKAV